MFINLYIARPRYHFILIYTCGLTVFIKRICYVTLWKEGKGRERKWKRRRKESEERGGVKPPNILA